MEKKRVCISIPVELITALEGIARHDARSPASLIHKVLNMSVKKADKKADKKATKTKKKKRS